MAMRQVQGQAGKSSRQVRDRVRLRISSPWPSTSWAARQRAVVALARAKLWSPSLKADPTGQRGTPAMASPQRRAGWEPLPTSPAGRGPPSAALFVSWPQALAAKPPGGEDALRALTWVFSRLSSLGWQTNAFFQHCDVFLQCFMFSVHVYLQHLDHNIFVTTLFPCFPASFLLHLCCNHFTLYLPSFKALNCSVHGTLVLVHV